MNYDMLFSPMKIGYVEIKHRFVLAPMCMGFGQYNGCATETMMIFYEGRIGRSGPYFYRKYTK